MPTFETPKSSDEVIRLMAEPELAQELGITLEELRRLKDQDRFDLQTRAAQEAARRFLEREKLPDEVFEFSRRGPRKASGAVAYWVGALADREVCWLKLENQPAAKPLFIHCFLVALQGLCRRPPGV